MGMVTQNQIITLEMPWNKLHREIQSLEVDAKKKAAQIGEMLIAKKANLKHGEFIPWVEANCEFTPRRAQQYIKVATTKNEQRFAFDVCSSINEVLDLAKKPKEGQATAEKKPKLDKDDRRKINKLRKIVNDPATPPAMKEAAEVKLSGYEEAHGKYFKEYTDNLREEDDNTEGEYNGTSIDRDYLADKMVETILKNLHKEPAKDYIASLILDAYEDDRELEREFRNLMQEVEIW